MRGAAIAGMLIVLAWTIFSGDLAAQDATGEALQQIREFYAKSGGNDQWVAQTCLPSLVNGPFGFDTAMKLQELQNRSLSALAMCKCVSIEFKEGYVTKAYTDRFVYVSGHKGKISQEELPKIQANPPGVDPKEAARKFGACVQKEFELASSGGR